MLRFKVGDLVSWAGANGAVVYDHKYKHPNAASLVVEFEHLVTSPGSAPRPIPVAFHYDGRLHFWHKEPSLRHRNAGTQKLSEDQNQRP